MPVPLFLFSHLLGFYIHAPSVDQVTRNISIYRDAIFFALCRISYFLRKNGEKII